MPNKISFPPPSPKRNDSTISFPQRMWHWITNNAFCRFISTIAHEIFAKIANFFSSIPSKTPHKQEQAGTQTQTGRGTAPHSVSTTPTINTEQDIILETVEKSTLQATLDGITNDNTLCLELKNLNVPYQFLADGWGVEAQTSDTALSPPCMRTLAAMMKALQNQVKQGKGDPALSEQLLATIHSRATQCAELAEKIAKTDKNQLYEIIDLCKNKIKDLKIGESLTIPGGWAALEHTQRGHASLYQVMRTKDHNGQATYSFQVLRTGIDSSLNPYLHTELPPEVYHKPQDWEAHSIDFSLQPSHTVEEFKRQFHPIKRWDNLSFAEITRRDERNSFTEFWRELIEPQIHTKTVYTNASLPSLVHEQKTLEKYLPVAKQTCLVPQEFSGFVSAQRAGTSTGKIAALLCRSTLQELSEGTDDKETLRAYKRLKYDIRILLLSHIYHNLIQGKYNSDSGQEIETALELLEKGTRKLSRSIGKLLKKGHFNQEEAAIAADTVKDLQQRVSEYKNHKQKKYLSSIASDRSLQALVGPNRHSFQIDTEAQAVISDAIIRARHKMQDLSQVSSIVPKDGFTVNIETRTKPPTESVADFIASGQKREDTELNESDPWKKYVKQQQEEFRPICIWSSSNRGTWSSLTELLTKKQFPATTHNVLFTNACTSSEKLKLADKPIGYTEQLFGLQNVPNSISHLIEACEKDPSKFVTSEWQTAFKMVVFRNENLSHGNGLNLLVDFLTSLTQKCQKKLTTAPRDVDNIQLLLFCYDLWQLLSVTQKQPLDQIHAAINASRNTLKDLLERQDIGVQAAQRLVASYCIEESLSLISAISIVDTMRYVQKGVKYTNRGTTLTPKDLDDPTLERLIAHEAARASEKIRQEIQHNPKILPSLFTSSVPKDLQELPKKTQNIDISSYTSNIKNIDQAMVSKMLYEKSHLESNSYAMSLIRAREKLIDAIKNKIKEKYNTEKPLKDSQILPKSTFTNYTFRLNGEEITQNLVSDIFDFYSRKALQIKQALDQLTYSQLFSLQRLHEGLKKQEQTRLQTAKETLKEQYEEEDSIIQNSQKDMLNFVNAYPELRTSWIGEFPLYTTYQNDKMIQVDLLSGLIYQDGKAFVAHGNVESEFEFDIRAPLQFFLGEKYESALVDSLSAEQLTHPPEGVSIDAQGSVFYVNMDFTIPDQDKPQKFQLLVMEDQNGVFKLPMAHSQSALLTGPHWTHWINLDPNSEVQMLVCGAHAPGMSPKPMYGYRKDGSSFHWDDPSLTSYKIWGESVHMKKRNVKPFAFVEGLLRYPDKAIPWLDKKGNLKKIELPITHNASKKVTFNADQDKLRWDTDPRFFISTIQQPPADLPISKFLLLENDNQEKIIMLPVEEYEKDFFGDRLKETRLLLCSIDSKGKILGNTVESTLHLAQLHMQLKNYDKALDALKAALVMRPLNTYEYQQLNDILSSQNNDPQAAAIRIYASHILRQHYLAIQSGEKDAHTHTALTAQQVTQWQKTIHEYVAFLKNPNVSKSFSPDQLFPPLQEIHWIEDTLQLFPMISQEVKRVLNLRQKTLQIKLASSPKASAESPIRVSTQPQKEVTPQTTLSEQIGITVLPVSDADASWKQTQRNAFKLPEGTCTPEIESVLTDLQQNLNTFLDQPQVHYELLPTQIEAGKNTLATAINEGFKKAQGLQQSILNLINTPHTGALERIYSKLQRISGEQPALTMEDAIRLFLQNDVGIWQQETFLNLEQITALHQQIAAYLITQTDVQHAQRCLEKLQDVQKAQKNPEQYRLAVQALGELAYTKRTYDPIQEPWLLVFEYGADVRIRTLQYDLICKLVVPYGHKGIQYQAEIVQLIMGGGKSKIITPILCYIKADGQHLSGIVLPEALYGSGREDIGNALYQNFLAHAVSIEFSRATCNLANLIHIDRIQERALLEKKTLIMRPEDLRSLYLMYDERLEYTRTHPYSVANKELKIIKKIISDFRRAGIFSYDEIDNTYRTRLQQNFALAEPVSIQKEGIEAGKILYTLLMTDPEYSSLDIRNNHQATQIVQMNYEPLKASLANKLWDQKFTSSKFLQGSDKQGYLDYILEKSSTEAATFEKKLQEMHTSTDVVKQKIATQMAYYKQTISKDLKEMLHSTAHVQYGLSKKDPDLDIVIPYSANEKPLEGSIFQNCWETVNKTFQYYGQTWKHPERTKKMVEFFQSRLKQLPTDTQLFNQCASIFGSDFLNKDVKDEKWIATITEQIDQKRAKGDMNTIELIFQFLEEHVLPTQVKIYIKQLNSTAQDFVHMAKVTQGYSGTLYGEKTWPQKLHVSPAAGTEELLISTLLKEQNNTCIELTAEESEEFFTELFTKMGSKEFVDKDGFIDVAPIFKGVPNRQVAEAILRASKKWVGRDIQAILTYETNSKGESQLALIKKDVKDPIFITGSSHQAIIDACKPLSFAQVFKFWPHAQTVGSDLPSEIKTTAFASFDPQVTLDQYLQGAARKRGLVSGTESICHVINTTTAKAIRQQLGLKMNMPIESKHLLIMAEWHKRQEEMELNYQATNQMIDSCVREHIRNKLLKTANEETEAIMYAQVHDLVVKTLENNLFAQFGSIEHPIPIDTYFAQKINKILESFPENSKDFDSTFQSLLRTQLEDIVKSQKQRAKLPKNIFQRKENDNGIAVAVQQQQQVQQHTHMQQQQMLDTDKKPAPPKQWPDHDPWAIPNFFTKSVKSTPFVKPIQEFFLSPIQEIGEALDKNIFVTENYITTLTDTPPAMRSSQQKPIHNVLVIEENGKHSMVLLSLEDEQFFSQKFEQRQKTKATGGQRRMWIVTPDGRLVQDDPVSPWKNPFIETSSTHTKERQRLLIQAMALKGDSPHANDPAIHILFTDWQNEAPYSLQRKKLLM